MSVNNIFVYQNSFFQGIEVFYNRYKNTCMIGEFDENNKMTLFKVNKIDILNGIIQGGVYSDGITFKLGYVINKNSRLRSQVREYELLQANKKNFKKSEKVNTKTERVSEQIKIKF